MNTWVGLRTWVVRLFVKSVTLALGVGLVLHVVHLDKHERHELAPLLHWLRDSGLAVPLAAFVVLTADLAARQTLLWLRSGGGGRRRDRHTARWAGALFGATTYATLSIPGSVVHAWLFVGPGSDALALDHLAADASVAALAALAVLRLLALTPSVAPGATATVRAGARSRPAAVRRPALRRVPRRAIAAASTLGVASALSVAPVAQPTMASAVAVGPVPGACSAGSADRSYDVAAISVPIPYNRFGDLDANGMIYVLEQDRAAVDNWFLPLNSDPNADPAGNRRLRPRPLVLRANEGECVSVTFTNRLNAVVLGGAVNNPRASMHASGVAYDAQTSDGGAVGYNEDTTVGINESITYFWRAPGAEGLFLFKDTGVPAGGEADGGSMSHGLWGGLAVEPAGSTWTDPRSGLPLYPPTRVNQLSGELYINADIRPPSGNSFRESIQISQDEIPGVGFGFNYGADAQRNRDRILCPDCVGEETSLSSWTYGDPAAVKLASGGETVGGTGWAVRAGANPEDCRSDDGVGRPALLMPIVNGTRVPASCWTSNVTHAYVGDPTKIRFAHAGIKETHVFHMHAHQWLAEARDTGTAGTNPTTPDNGDRRPESMTIDSQTYGPGDSFTADLLFGAGSKNGTIGDAIFHCHLYPHFADGFWSLFRTHDVREDGTGTTPDGIRTPTLLPLPDRQTAGTLPPVPTADNPGYPRFIPGKYGWRAPQPPSSISDADGTPATRIVAGQGLDPALLNQVQEVSTSSAAVDEVQSISTTATEGTFTLGLGDATTADLAVTSTGPEVQAALESLPAIGAGNVSVVGGGSVSDPWIVTFRGALGDRDVAQLTATDASASGSTTVTTTTAGADGGTFVLDYRGQKTGAIAYDAAATTVRAALEGLSTIQAVTVSGAGTAVDPWIVTFKDPQRNVRALTSTASLSSGSVSIARGANDVLKALSLEREVQKRRYPNSEPLPGAPLADPCPKDARLVTYDVTVLQTDITYNEAGWHDTQGRMLVRTEDVPAIDAGTLEPEPLFIRVNAGDCINFNLTNRLPNWYGNDAFQILQQTNMFGEHIHLVKFDVTGSDGSSNGWNYQQAAFTKLQADFNAAVIDGARTCSADEASGACRLALPGPGGYSPTEIPKGVGQTIHERWYADYELRTVFTHDHHFPAVDQGRGLFGALIVEPTGMDFRNSRTGHYEQPINDPAHGTTCGQSCEGTAAGAAFDIIGPGASDDFREFGLAFQDFVPLTKAGGDPQNPADVFNPPAAPETFADDDPGVMGVNYRNAPYLLRNSVNGVPTDPAYVFSSTLHGDPATPVLQAYAGDPVRVRLIAGSQEEQHNFALHGMRWRDEPDDPQSQLVGSKSLGVSEAFNFEIPEMECAENTDCRGDYLYTSAGTDDVYLGMWGLMRVFGKGVDGLRPLPDNTPQAVKGTTQFAVTHEPPAPANNPGAACPTGASVKAFRVAATDARITYSQDPQGDHDPYGLVYVAARPGETIDHAVARARLTPEPMAIRANEGDCLEVTLYNRIDPNGDFAKKHGPLGVADGDPSLPLEPPTGTPAGLRVSLHPQLLKYDIRGSDGATVGFNRDQTVAPGQQILYRWYADAVSPGQLGAINLTDYGDVRGHRHHGMFGSLTIEPKGATYHDPITGAPMTSGAVADIRIPGQPDFREFTVMFQDGLNLRDATGALIPDGFAHPPAPGEPAERLDAEDQGEKGFNYAAEPFRNRLGMVPMAADAVNPLDGTALAHVFSSRVHGDPATPIFRAYAGDPVRVRVVQGADKPRQNTIAINGHSWLSDPEDLQSDVIGARGGMTVNRALNLELGAAGAGNPGDYLYSNPVGFHHLSGGMWGLLRVYRAISPGPLFEPDPLAPGSTSLTAGDNPSREGYHPLQPLEQTTLTVSVFDDSNVDGARGNAELAGPNAIVTVTPAGATSPAVTREVDAQGRATFSVGRGAYDVATTAPSDWSLTTSGSVRVDLTAENAWGHATFGMVQLGDVGIRLFKDANADGVVDSDETPLAGWPVQLSKGTDSRRGSTADDGTVVFTDLVPGTWSVTSGAAGWLATRKLPAAVVVAEGATRSPTTDSPLGFTLKAGLSVKIFNDADQNSTQDPGESSKAGWKITAVGGPPEQQVTVTATTDANGVATFVDPDPTIVGLRPGAWTLTPAMPPDWSLVGGSAVTTTSTSGPTPGFSCAQATCQTVLLAETTQVVTLRASNPYVRILAVPYVDANNDGVKQGSETKLVGWPATLYPVLDGGGLGEGVALDSGNDGRADFYPLPGNTYLLEMISPAPSTDLTIPSWTTTNRADCAAYATDQRRCTATVVVKDGETGVATFGFIQLGVVSAQVFHDYDQDRERDDIEPALAHRTVTLWNSTGKTVLATALTDASGRASFNTNMGTKYMLGVAVPTGWTQTAPVDSKGAAITKLAVVGPSPSTQAEIMFGQYNTADSTPPPVPQPSVAGGSYDTPQTVALASETGALIRYTLDGTMPTVTHGMKYAGPFTIAGTWTLRAVAVDSAGNVSGELGPADPSQPRGMSYIITIAGAMAGQGQATTWTVVQGGAPSGDPSTALATDDSDRLLVPSAFISKSKGYGLDGYATIRLPVGQRDVAALGLVFDSGARLPNATASLWVYDWTGSTWDRLLADDTLDTLDLKAIVYVSGDPRRYVGPNGDVRVRRAATRTSGAFDLQVDQAIVRYLYR